MFDSDSSKFNDLHHIAPLILNADIHINPFPLYSICYTVQRLRPYSKDPVFYVWQIKRMVLEVSLAQSEVIRLLNTILFSNFCTL